MHGVRRIMFFGPEIPNSEKGRHLRNSALVDHLVSAHKIRDGEQEVPAFAVEDERTGFTINNVDGSIIQGGDAVFVGELGVGMDMMGLNEPEGHNLKSLGVIKRCGINIEVEWDRGARSLTYLEFVSEPMPINQYTQLNSCKHWMVSRFLNYLKLNAEVGGRVAGVDCDVGSSVKITKDVHGLNKEGATLLFVNGGVYDLGGGTTFHSFADFEAKREGPMELATVKQQFNISLPISAKALEVFVQSTGAQEDCFRRDTSKWPFVCLFRDVYKESCEIFDYYLGQKSKAEQDVMGEETIDYMKGVFINIVVKGVVHSMFLLAQTKAGEEMGFGLSTFKNIYSLFARFDNEATNTIVDDLESFVSFHKMNALMDHGVGDWARGTVATALNSYIEGLESRDPAGMKQLNALLPDKGDVVKMIAEQAIGFDTCKELCDFARMADINKHYVGNVATTYPLLSIGGRKGTCLLYTSDAADDM
jgi:hypothetical protein